MSEPARISCCIAGCRRTFRAELCGDGDIICGRHYKCAPELKRLLLESRRLWFKLVRLGDAHARRSGGLVPVKVVKAMRTCMRRHDRRWAALKAEAQRQQDAGFFAPKPRRRKSATCAKTQTSPLAGRFEDQFQRLKRAQEAARGTC